VVGIKHAIADNGLMLNLPFNAPAGFADAALPFELVVKDGTGREKPFSRILSILKGTRSSPS
jgi:hypothetical protein